MKQFMSPLFFVRGHETGKEKVENMKNETVDMPQTDNESKLAVTADTAPAFGDKKDVARMLKMSVRSVDNYVAAGCPTIFLSKRRLRFDLLAVRDWFKSQYGGQRMGKAGGKAQ